MNKKFLIVGNSAFSLLKFRKNMMLQIAAQGYEIHCAVYETDPAEQIQELKTLGFKTHSLKLERKGMNPLADLGYTMALLKLVRELNPQKSFFYTIKPVIYGGLALLWQRCCSEHKRQPRSMAMITGLGFAFMDQSLKQKIAGWVARVLYKVALRGHDVLVFENPDDQAFFKEAGLIPGSIEVLRVDGSGVPTEDFPLTSLPFQKVQKGAAVKFLMIARVLRAKGIVEYAEAAALVRSRYREGAEFFYLGGLDPGGDGLSAEEFKTLCQRGSIHYLGEMGDVRPAIASCDVVVLPSYREGLPRSSLEAMAMGRVIVTSDVPGCRETVLHGQNGLLVPVRNARALAEALCQIIETAQHSPEKLHSMAHMSRKLCEERFDIKKVNRDLLGGLGIAYP